MELNTELAPRHQHLIDSVFAHIQSETKLFVDRVSTVLQTCQATAYSPPVECGNEDLVARQDLLGLIQCCKHGFQTTHMCSLFTAILILCIILFCERGIDERRIGGVEGFQTLL